MFAILITCFPLFSPLQVQVPNRGHAEPLRRGCILDFGFDFYQCKFSRGFSSHVSAYTQRVMCSTCRLRSSDAGWVLAIRSHTRFVLAPVPKHRRRTRRRRHGVLHIFLVFMRVDLFANWKSQEVDPPPPPPLPRVCGCKVNHAVVLAGYGTEEYPDGNVDYWVVRNSWGPDWGEGGYVRLYRGNESNTCGFADNIEAAVSLGSMPNFSVVC